MENYAEMRVVANIRFFKNGFENNKQNTHDRYFMFIFHHIGAYGSVVRNQ